MIKICSMTDGLMSSKPKNTASSDHSKVTRSANYYLNSMTRRWSLCHQRTMRLTDHHVVRTKWQPKLNTSLYHLAIKTDTKLLRYTHMISGRA